jgi:Domain of unknown function (DUF4386)
MTTKRPAPSSGRTGGANTDTPGVTARGMRRSALVAGVGILVMSVLAGAATFVAIQGLVTKGDATRTAKDILASEGLFRLGIAALVVVVILDVVVAWALLTFFEPADKGLATLAAWLRLGYAAIFAVAISQLVGVLPLLSNARYLTTFSIDQRRTEALLKIQGYQDIWNVSLVLFGLHLVLIGYLAYKSGYVPRVLGVLLVIAGGGYLVDSFGGLLVASYSVSVAAFTFIGEALLMLWLLVKGRNVTPRAWSGSSAAE